MANLRSVNKTETDAEYRARRKQYSRAAYVRRLAAGECVLCRAPYLFATVPDVLRALS